ncbi:MAG: ABC transporter transmembrane domain-containing protein, partial [Turicibacter sp.]
MSNKPMASVRPGGGPGPHMNLGRKAEKLKNPKQTLIRLLRYMGDKKLSLFLIVVFGIVATLVTIVGTKLNGDIVDDYIMLGDMSGLFRICWILIAMYVVSALANFIQNRLMVKISQTTGADIRRDLFEKMQSLPLKYFDTHSSGDLMSRLTNDVDN